MKKHFSPAIFLLTLAFVFTSAPASAQYDDVYYTPEDRSYTYTNDNTYVSENENYEEEVYAEETATADDSYYDGDFGNSDYEYSSRIRRFRRPVSRFDYYDPFYVDAGYYDPFWRGGFNNVYIYNSPNVAFQRVYTPYGPRVVAVDRFGWNRGLGWNRGFNRWNTWNDPYAFGGWNGGFGDPYWGGGFNTFGAFGGPVGYYQPAFNGRRIITQRNDNRFGNRAVTSQPRGSTYSISDRLERINRERAAENVNTRSSADRSRTARRPVTRSGSQPVPTRSTSRSRRIDNDRPAARPQSRSAQPSRSVPSRSTAPRRSVPRRSTSPSRSVPKQSAIPSRSTAPSRSVPSRSSSSRSGSSRGRGQ